MADDTSYSTFLSKANEDPTSGRGHTTASYTESTSQARSAHDPSTSEAGIPGALRNLPSVPYVSDTDSDFEPVFFSYASDALPSAEEFENVLRHNRSGLKSTGGGSVTELDLKDFDPRGSYSEIVQRVEQVAREEEGRKRGGSGGGGGGGGGASGGKGVVKVFRVELDRTRVEYYVLTVGERKLVGVVAKAVES